MKHWVIMLVTYHVPNFPCPESADRIYFETYAQCKHALAGGVSISYPVDVKTPSGRFTEGMTIIQPKCEYWK